MTSRELDVMAELATARGGVVSWHRLRDLLWGGFVGRQAHGVFISRLRGKLRPGLRIATVPTVGCRLIADDYRLPWE